MVTGWQQLATGCATNKISDVVATHEPLISICFYLMFHCFILRFLSSQRSSHGQFLHNDIRIISFTLIGHRMVVLVEKKLHKFFYNWNEGWSNKRREWENKWDQTQAVLPSVATATVLSFGTQWSSWLAGLNSSSYYLELYYFIIGWYAWWQITISTVFYQIHFE